MKAHSDDYDYSEYHLHNYLELRPSYGNIYCLMFQSFWFSSVSFLFLRVMMPACWGRLYLSDSCLRMLDIDDLDSSYNYGVHYFVFHLESYRLQKLGKRRIKKRYLLIAYIKSWKLNFYSCWWVTLVLLKKIIPTWNWFHQDTSSWYI